MTPKLRNMLTLVGVVVLGTGGGVGYLLNTPQPSTRTMLELRDAGITDGQRFVLTCPERLTARTKRRVRDVQGTNVLRPRQSYARIARVAFCFNPDGGNCFRPADFVPRVNELEGEVIVPSLRRNLNGLDPVGSDDGGEDDVDDALQYRLDACSAQACSTYDAGAGLFPNPFCNNLNRLMLVAPPNMMPLCIGPDGGWDDEAGEPGHIAAPDCKFGGPYGRPDGGPLWRGCNSYPAQYASGSACVPVESGVVAGDLINAEWL